MQQKTLKDNKECVGEKRSNQIKCAFFSPATSFMQASPATLLKPQEPEQTLMQCRSGGEPVN